MTEAAVNDEPGASALAAYTRVYEEHNARLVAYALTLTGNPATAEDLVAEAHFRVWRRISAGHTVENVPAYLATTIRNLANTLHRTTTEIPLPTGPAEAEFGRPSAAAASTDDLSQQVAHVDFVTRLLKDLPERWVHALWLSEVEDLPLEAVGQRIGANSNATAVLLNRAREGLRQAFLRGYPGMPAEEACAKHWQKIPSLVRGGLSARQTDSLRAHAAQCDDCRARMAALQQVNLRLPVLLGPALLLLGLGGGALRAVVAGAAGAAGGAKAGGAAAGAHHLRHVGGKLRHGVSHGAGKAAAVSAGVVGSTAIAVAAVALTGGAAHPSGASHAPAESQPAKTQAAKTQSAKSSVPVAKTTPATPAAKPPAPAPAPTHSQPSATPVQYTPRHAAAKAPTPPPATAPSATAPPSTSASAPSVPKPVQAAAAVPAPAAPQQITVATQPSATPTPSPTVPAAPAPSSTATPPTQPPSSTPSSPPSSSTTSPPTTAPSTTAPSKPDHDIDVSVTVNPQHKVTVTLHVPLSSKSPG